MSNLGIPDLGKRSGTVTGGAQWLQISFLHSQVSKLSRRMVHSCSTDLTTDTSALRWRRYDERQKKRKKTEVTMATPPESSHTMPQQLYNQQDIAVLVELLLQGKKNVVVGCCCSSSNCRNKNKKEISFLAAVE